MAVVVTFPAPGVGQVLTDRPEMFNAFDEVMIGWTPHSSNWQWTTVRE